MSSGEVTVAVEAEGVDEAADAASQGVAAEMPDADEGAGGDIVSQLGSIGRLLGLATALLAALGPLKDMLGGVLNVLSAFLAPMAMMLMRIFQPVLRLLIQLLPAWFAFMGFVDDLLDSAVEFLSSLPGRIWSFMRDLPGMIWSAISSGASWLAEGAANIGSAVWSAIKSGASWFAEGASNIGSAVWSAIKDGADWATNLPGEIASELHGLGVEILESADPREGGGFLGIGGTEEDPGFFRSLGQDVGDLLGLASGGVVSQPTPALVGEAGPEAVIPLDRFERMMGDMGGGTRIELRGGLSEFVSGARRDPNIDL